MINLSLRRYSRITVGVGLDEALVSWPVPADCRLVNLRGECHVQEIQNANFGPAIMYGVDGWYIPMVDEIVGDYADQNALWDEMVPKEDNVRDLDDDSAAVADSSFEIGEMSLPLIFGESFGSPKRIYKRRKLLTLANSQNMFVDTDTLGADNAFLRDVFSVNKKFCGGGKQHGAVIFGLGLPDNTVGLSSTVVSSLASGSVIGSLNVLRYLEDFLHMAVIDLDNAWEVGAESPWEDVLDFLVVEMEKSQGDALFTDSSGMTATMVAVAQLITPGLRRQGSFGPDGTR